MFLKLYTETISREVINDTFLIDFDGLKEKIISFKNLSNDELMSNIHWLCIELLKNYLLNTKNYFEKCTNEFQLNSINLYLWKYAFENFKLLINIDYDNDKIISIEEGFQNFININCKNNENSKYERDFENFKKNLKKSIKDDDNLDFMFNKKCNNNRKYNIYKDLSIIFAYTIDNWGECSYNRDTILKKNVYKNDGKFLSSFIILNNININDIYYFERIYNINFKLCLHKYIINLYKYNVYFNESEIMKLIEAFSSIIYLPNVFYNENLLVSLIRIYVDYYGNYYIEDFKKSVEILCNDITRYYLPLYNSVFFQILHFYCEIHNINIKDITKEVSANINLTQNIYYILLKEKVDQVEGLNIFEKLIEQGDDKERNISKKIYYLINRVMSYSFNFNKLNNESIINNINIRNERVLKDISSISDYQLILKEFILKLNKLNLEASDI